MKKILVSIVAVLISGVAMLSPVVFSNTGVFAEEKCVLTNTLGNDKCDADGNKGQGDFNCSCDDGQGGAVKETLKLVLNIMTVGIGILAVLGVTIVGIQYLTAGGNEEQVRKSKRRLLEIVIGVVAYVLIYALLNFLIPDFNPNF